MSRSAGPDTGEEDENVVLAENVWMETFERSWGRSLKSSSWFILHSFSEEFDPHQLRPCLLEENNLLFCWGETRQVVVSGLDLQIVQLWSLSQPAFENASSHTRLTLIKGLCKSLSTAAHESWTRNLVFSFCVSAEAPACRGQTNRPCVLLRQSQIKHHDSASALNLVNCSCYWHIQVDHFN